MDPGLLRAARSCLDRLEERYPEVGGRVRLSAGGYGDAWLAIAGHLSVTLNAPFWTPGFLARHAAEWKGLVVAADADGIVTHEFGHVLFRTAERVLGFAEANRMAMEYAGTGRWDSGIAVDRAASPYGQENVSECMAESFSAFHYGRAEAGPFSAVALANARTFWSGLLARMAAAPEPGQAAACGSAPPP